MNSTGISLAFPHSFGGPGAILPPFPLPGLRPPPDLAPFVHDFHDGAPAHPQSPPFAGHPSFAPPPPPSVWHGPVFWQPPACPHPASSFPYNGETSAPAAFGSTAEVADDGVERDTDDAPVQIELSDEWARRFAMTAIRRKHRKMEQERQRRKDELDSLKKLAAEERAELRAAAEQAAG
eukprot:tig00001093_g6882.t1